MYYINRLKEKKHIIISIDEEKAFSKIKNKEFFSLLRTYQKLIVHIKLIGEIIEAFPLNKKETVTLTVTVIV